MALYIIAVETSQAGPGNLEVTVNGGRVPTSAQAQGPHTYAISFTPREAVPHSVDLRFNGQDVPGSPFKCIVAPAARIIAPEALDKVSVGRVCMFAVESPSSPVVEVLGPARRSLPTQVCHNLLPVLIIIIIDDIQSCLQAWLFIPMSGHIWHLLLNVKIFSRGIK